MKKINKLYPELRAGQILDDATRELNLYYISNSDLADQIKIHKKLGY